MNRKEGFYWVTYNNEYIVVQYKNNEWLIPGNENSFNDSYFEHIGTLSIDKDSEDELSMYSYLFGKFNKALIPIEDLWRQENSPNEFVLPDTESLLKWAEGKIKLANELSK